MLQKERHAKGVVYDFEVAFQADEAHKDYSCVHAEVEKHSCVAANYQLQLQAAVTEVAHYTPRVGKQHQNVCNHHVF